MKRFLLGIGFSLILLSPAWAETATLTLDQAMDMAIRNNPQLSATQARLQVSEAEILTAGARLNPSLISDNGIAEKTYREGIEQTFELGGKRRRRVAVSRAQRDVVRAEINAALLDLRADVRRAYTQLYNTQERRKSYENILQVAQELVIIAQKREKAGDIAVLDVLQTDIVRVNAQNDLQSVSAELLNAHTRLNALLNQPLASTVTLAPPNTTPQLTTATAPAQPLPLGTLQGQVTESTFDLDSLIAQALANRPEIQQNQLNIEVTRLQTALARANRIPNVTLAGGADIVTGDEGETSAFIIGTMEIPLFNRQQGPMAEALARRTQFEKESAALRNRVTAEVTTAYNAYQSHQDRIKRYETVILPMSVAIVDKSRRAFQEGKIAILTPIQAQQAYINTRLGYLQAMQDYQNAISDLERAVGTGL